MGITFLIFLIFSIFIAAAMLPFILLLNSLIKRFVTTNMPPHIKKIFTNYLIVLLTLILLVFIYSYGDFFDLLNFSLACLLLSFLLKKLAFKTDPFYNILLMLSFLMIFEITISSLNHVFGYPDGKWIMFEYLDILIFVPAILGGCISAAVIYKTRILKYCCIIFLVLKIFPLPLLPGEIGRQIAGHLLTNVPIGTVISKIQVNRMFGITTTGNHNFPYEYKAIVFNRQPKTLTYLPAENYYLISYLHKSGAAGTMDDQEPNIPMMKAILFIKTLF